MNRILIAFLALLTGLIMPVTPVQARIAGNDTEIGAVEAGRVGARTVVSNQQGVMAPVVRQDRRDREAAKSRPIRPRVYIPSVLFGTDRALE